MDAIELFTSNNVVLGLVCCSWVSSEIYFESTTLIVFFPLVYLLGERVHDIAFWKSELNNEIGAMENEINDLKVLTSPPSMSITLSWSCLYNETFLRFG